MDVNLDYGQDRELAKQFLKDFTDVNNDGQLITKYPSLLTKLANREVSHIFIDLKDVEKYNHDYATRIGNNTVRATKIFYEAIDEILPSFKTQEPAVKDIMDVFVEQRLMVLEQNRKAQTGVHNANPTPTQNINQNHTDIDGIYPPELIRRYEIYFKPSSFLSTPIRQVLADKIGKLVTVRGIVTRTTDVVPRLSVATYSCDQCGFETFQPIPDLVFMPLFECTSSVCKANKSVGKITMQSRGSKYIKYQEIKLQEHTDQVPEGHIPRSITIHITGELTRSCDPGDHISVSGVFLPLERSAYRLRTGGLTAETFIETHYIAKMNKTEDDELNTEPMTQDEAELFVGGRSNFLKRLANSIAPEIYGCEDIKKSLLLLLVGGVDRNAHGMRIRGNINVCLMGDPGVAKSQLLIFIDRLASRSQYTTGRGSSGVGLTAAVLRDPVSNELVLEGGALVLADQGICCIDEFDKMMDADRTAIHEVMEQQTVSIAKAGIMTTLNARVSILAAANPAYGRYDPRHSLTDNLQLPPALLSRFDLLWLIRDIPSNEKDLNLAQHITNVHTHPEQQVSVNQDVIDMKSMRRYLALCKLKNPLIPRELTSKLVDIYLDIRGKAREQKRLGKEQDILFTSPRSLLAIIRLATAFCRLRLGDVLEELDIDAAFNLYASSRDSIDGFTSESSKIHMLKEIITDLLNHSENARVLRTDVEEEAFARKMSKDQIDDAYEGLKSAETILEHGDGYISLVDVNFDDMMEFSEF